MEEVIKIIALLDSKDKESLLEFASILFKKSKYNALREEIEIRRSEIINGEVLSHNELWQDV